MIKKGNRELLDAVHPADLNPLQLVLTEGLQTFCRVTWHHDGLWGN